MSRTAHWLILLSEAGQDLGFLCECWADPMCGDDHQPYGRWEGRGADEITPGTSEV